MDAIKILGSLLGGGGVSRGASGDLIGGLLRQAMGGGGAAPASTGGGLGDLLGAVTGGRAPGLGAAAAPAGGSGGAAGGGLGGILGGIAMAALAKYASGRMGGAGASSALENLFGGGAGSAFAAAPAEDPTTSAGAEVLVRAMIQAAKADGRVDADEERAIVERMNDLDAAERAFVQRVLREPVDASALARSVPRGMEREVYAISLVAMDVDQRSEARFLHELAQGLGMSAEQCNAIHREMREPEIFR